MTEQIKNIRLFSHFNRKGFLHVEHAIGEGFNKIKFFAGIREDGKMTQDYRHFVSIPDARLLCYKLISRQIGVWGSMKGAPQANHLTCRIMSIRQDKTDQDKFFVNVGRGPGQEGPNGIIIAKQNAPKEAFPRASVMMYEDDLIKMALTVQAWLNAVTAMDVMTNLPSGALVREGEHETTD